jgi:membrane-associated phospholipid phosphatase
VRSSRCHLVIAAILATLPAGCGRPPADDPRVIGEWIHALYGIVRVERLSPPVGARVFAYASTALYLGMASADPARADAKNLLNRLPEIPRAESGHPTDPTLTAIAAERVALDSLFLDGLPTTRSTIARLADSLEGARATGGISTRVRADSKALGDLIGNAIIAWSRTDGFDATRGRPYKPPVGPGLWVNDNPSSNYTTQNISGVSEAITPENPSNARGAANSSDRGLILSRPKSGSRTLPAVNMAGATEPYWGELRPVVLPTWDACSAPKLDAYTGKPGSQLYEQARQVFETSKALTPEQHQVTLYWADNAGETGTPAGHWLSIAGEMVGEQHLNAIDAARLMMATSVALHDAFIATWGYKFTYNLIRPRTFIRRAMDPKWEPSIPTPPFPEYMSGHSAVSAAAAGVITSALGPRAFDDSTSIALGHPVRHFASFSDAAHEAGQSRIYGGIHYPMSNLVGRAIGECVAGKVAARLTLGTPQH